MKTTRRFTFLAVLWLAVTMMLLCAGTAFASDDNSLSDLGITTQGATVSPDFRYDIWEYSVQVPAGTDADQRINRRKWYADSHDQRGDPPV